MSQRLIRARSLLAVAVLATMVAAQNPPSPEEQQKLAREYLVADDTRIAAIEATLKLVPPLSKADAAAWTATVRKDLKGGAPRLDTKGTAWFYDAKTKRGKYIVAGAGNRKGLVFGLHGGGVGSADGASAASEWSGAIQSAGMVGIFPQAIEATEAAWGDDVTVKFVLDLLAAARRSLDFDPDHVYVVGHSMGGYGAWTWAGRFSDRLAAAVSFAGSPTPVFAADRSVRSIQEGVVPNFRNVPFWSYHSLDDPRVPVKVTQFAIAELKALHEADPTGYDYRYEEVNGRGHDFPAKGPGPAIAWMVTKKRDPRPHKVVWQPFYERADQSYWLSVAQSRRGGTIEATWDGKSTFKIDADATAGAGVLLDDAMTDLDAPVTVIVDDKTVFAAVPQRSLITLLRSARRRGDPGMLFSARVPPEVK